MSIWRRSWFAFGALVALATVGIVWARVGRTLVDLGTGNGPFTGPFSEVIKTFEQFYPVLLASLVVAVAVYVVIGGIQRERSVNQRRPPPK